MNIESVQKKYEEELMRLPNVRAVGIGEKAGKKIIAVFVTHKVPESALQPHEIVRKKLGGYDTDVVELGGDVMAQNQRHQ